MISKDEIIKLIEKAEEGPTLDYKEDLPLAKDGDKAQFVKDVLALANSGELAHIIVGVEDGTGKPVGLVTTHDAEQLNQILKDKCDPPISVEYTEKDILGYKIGIIEINCDNPPYIVSVPDKFGGCLSSNPNKSFSIQRGTVFIRNYNRNEGAKRADLDKLYDKIKYVSLRADLQLSYEISVKPLDDSKEVSINFFLVNHGDVVATDTYIWLQFKNIKKIIQCAGSWSDVSHINNDAPTVQLIYDTPIISLHRMHCREVTVHVDSDTEQIETRLKIGAANMRTTEGDYVIALKK